MLLLTSHLWTGSSRLFHHPKWRASFILQCHAGCALLMQVTVSCSTAVCCCNTRWILRTHPWTDHGHGMPGHGRKISWYSASVPQPAPISGHTFQQHLVNIQWDHQQKNATGFVCHYWEEGLVWWITGATWRQSFEWWNVSFSQTWI